MHKLNSPSLHEMLLQSENVIKLKSIMSRNRHQLLYTILIFFNQFAYGISLNMLGATLVDMRFIYSVSLNFVSYMPVAAGIGYLIGSFASYLYGMIPRQLALSIFVLIISVTLAWLPRYGALNDALIALFVMGIGSGAWDSAVIFWLVDMWPAPTNAPIIQVSQFMYGVGSIVAPILVADYVYGEATTRPTDTHNLNRANNNNNNNNTFNNNNNNGKNWTTITVQDRIDSLSEPFVIAAIIQAIVPIIFLILYYVEPNRVSYAKMESKSTYSLLKTHDEDDEEEDDDIAADKRGDRLKIVTPHNDSCNHHKNGAIVVASTESNTRIDNNNLFSQRYRLTKLLLCGLCLANYSTARIGHFYFSAAVLQHLPIRLSAMAAVHLMSLSSTAYTLGRLLTSFISIKLTPDVILSYHYGILFTSLAFLYYGQADLTCVTIGTTMIGYGFSAMWPTIFAFTERYLRLTERVCGFFTFLSGTLSLIIPLILGQSFHSQPIILFKLEAIFIAISLTTFLVVRYWIQRDANLPRVATAAAIPSMQKKRSHIF